MGKKIAAKQIVPKRVRNDRAKRSARQKQLDIQKRKRQFAAAGMAGSYAKGARFVLAAAERDTENVAEQEEGPKDLYVETKPKTVQEESKPDLYVISTREEPNVIKIGQSTDPRRRLRSLQTANSKVLVLKVIFPNAGKYEHEVHEALAQERLLGEWFRVYLPVALTVISETVEKCSLRDLASSPSQFDTATKQSQGSTAEPLAPVNVPSAPSIPSEGATAVVEKSKRVRHDQEKRLATKRAKEAEARKQLFAHEGVPYAKRKRLDVALAEKAAEAEEECLSPTSRGWEGW